MFRLCFLCLVIFMVSCSKANIQSYNDTTPQLNLRTFFDGDLKVYGMLQNRQGKVTRKFTADIIAKWDGPVGTLDETFYFDDGEVSKRFWTLNDLGDGNFSGVADDVVGEAKGRVNGFAFHWLYTLEVPYKDGTINVKLDDWLYLVTDKRLLNKSVLKKFGFEVGQLTLVIEKL